MCALCTHTPSVSLEEREKLYLEEDKNSIFFNVMSHFEDYASIGTAFRTRKATVCVLSLSCAMADVLCFYSCG